MKQCILMTVTISILLNAMGCGRDKSLEYMAFDDVEYVMDFPKNFMLDDGLDASHDLIGISGFCIYDSLLILSSKNEVGLWTFISLDNDSILDSFLKHGDGPNEFLSIPSAGHNSRVFKCGEQLFAGLYDSNKGKVYKMNASESLRKKSLDIELINELPERSGIFNFVMLDDSTYLCKEISPTETKQERSVWKNSVKEEPEILKRLNAASIEKASGMDYNILSTITKKHRERDFFVEMPVGLNYLNIYSLGSNMGKTICIGAHLDKISDIQRKDMWSRIYTFSDVRIFSDFWGCVLIGEEERAFQKERKKKPCIILFDLDGNPLAKIQSSRFITSFDIDFKNGYLYTLDNQYDEFYRYDISVFLEEIRSFMDGKTYQP